MNRPRLARHPYRIAGGVGAEPIECHLAGLRQSQWLAPDELRDPQCRTISPPHCAKRPAARPRGRIKGAPAKVAVARHYNWNVDADFLARRAECLR